MPRSAAGLLREARRRIRRLEPVEAWAAMAGGSVLIDTRCADARRMTGTIPGAHNVPLSVLPWRLDPRSPFRARELADRRRPVVLLCDHGYSSSLAALMLRELGYADVADVIGGFEAWRDAGLPVEPARRRPPA